MKRLLVIATVLSAAIATQASAGNTRNCNANCVTPRVDNTIYVSCFRGPWKEVIWDRANPNFIDSLVNIGYDFPTAHAIGDRVCRDASLVGNPEAMRNEMLRIYYESPAQRRGVRPATRSGRGYYSN